MNDVVNGTVRSLGEKRIIADIIGPACGRSQFAVTIGIGDDAAMLPVPAGDQLLVSTDKIPEDLLAIQLGLMDAYHHGRYLATVNISDIAAMGGNPLGLLVTLALPDSFELAYLSDFYRGLSDACSEWGIGVIGGDLGWGSMACLSATAVGSVRPDQVLRRSLAMSGDNLFVTGPIGGFNTALIYFIVAKPRGMLLAPADEAYLVARLTRPTAQVAKGKLLAQSGRCSSCMDMTDGVARTITELAAASGVTFNVEEYRMPVHSSTVSVARFLGIATHELVFGIGLDLELMGTLRGPLDDLSSELQEAITIIGTVTNGPSNTLSLRSGETTVIPDRGWQHFAGGAMDMVKRSVPART